jgi:hypothetical protein
MWMALAVGPVLTQVNTGELMATKDLAQVKLESAHEIRQKMMLLCLKQCESPDDRYRLKIGSYLGDFTNNLRSALNYTMRHFAEARLKPVLRRNQYKAMNRDFPWSSSRGAFDKKAVIEHTRCHYETVYDFLESVQPYHEGNEWLKHLMRISNKDKHVIINEIKTPKETAVSSMKPNGTPNPFAGFFGPGFDRILVIRESQPCVHQCPHYYHPFGAFAVKGGKWVFFFISIDQVNLGLLRFMERVTQNVETLTDDFVMLVGGTRFSSSNGTDF